MSLKVQLYREKEKLKRRIQRSRHGHCTVLLYHRVIDLKYDPQLLCVSPDNFEKQLSALKKNGTFIDINEFTDILTSGRKFPRNAFLITFDDGYADNLHNAAPVLEALGLPAVFYISTAGIGADKLMWWDELDLVFKNLKNAGSIESLLQKHKVTDPDSLYKYYLSACKTSRSLKERDDLMTEIRSISEISDRENYRMLTLEELKKLASVQKITIGAHTVNHLSLGHISPEDKITEILDSIKWLKENLSTRIKHFSFPYGEKVNYDEMVLTICKEIKLKSAAANYEGYVTKGSDIYSFPRYVVRNDTPEILFEKMRGIL